MKTPACESPFNKITGFQLVTLFKERLRRRCFSVNLSKFLRNLFSFEHFQLTAASCEFECSTLYRHFNARFTTLDKTTKCKVFNYFSRNKNVFHERIQLNLYLRYLILSILLVFEQLPIPGFLKVSKCTQRNKSQQTSSVDLLNPSLSKFVFSEQPGFFIVLLVHL